MEGEMVAGQVETYLMKLASGQKPDETRFSYPGIDTMRKKRLDILKRKKDVARKKAETGAKTITCIMCPNGCEINYDLEGGMCGKGPEYVKNEILNPKRTLTTSVKVTGGAIPLVSVKTTESIAKENLMDAMKLISEMEVEAPVEMGQVICGDFMEPGVNLVATKSVKSAEYGSTSGCLTCKRSVNE
jgi:CxxC motif-containing protein